MQSPKRVHIQFAARSVDLLAARSELTPLDTQLMFAKKSLLVASKCSVQRGSHNVNSNEKRILQVEQYSCMTNEVVITVTEI